jgi:hypothetical protein
LLFVSSSHFGPEACVCVICVILFSFLGKKSVLMVGVNKPNGCSRGVEGDGTGYGMVKFAFD